MGGRARRLRHDRELRRAPRLRGAHGRWALVVLRAAEGPHWTEVRRVPARQRAGDGAELPRVQSAAHHPRRSRPAAQCDDLSPLAGLAHGRRVHLLLHARPAPPLVRRGRRASRALGGRHDARARDLDHRLHLRALALRGGVTDLCAHHARRTHLQRGACPDGKRARLGGCGRGPAHQREAGVRAGAAAHRLLSRVGAHEAGRCRPLDRELLARARRVLRLRRAWPSGTTI